MNELTAISHSFAPLVAGKPKILILGSMPGIASLEAQRYYAHPRNTFWPMLAEILGFDAQATYPERCSALTQNHIALWDVLKSCHRQGSLDQNIHHSTMQVNDFNQFLNQHTSIRSICFNGKKAAEVFQRYALPQLTDRELVFFNLPSSSPAHAAISKSAKLEQWQAIIRKAVAVQQP
jgi:hypoxanthine-DNA glycosylase